jgi:predicted RNase H-like HicB family nuclease
MGPVKLKVILSEEPEGGYSVAVPALPGCFSEGETEAEALANAREAAVGWLEAGNGNPSPFADGEGAVKEVVREIDL